MRRACPPCDSLRKANQTSNRPDDADAPGGLANRSGAGDLDVIIYFARKWAQLAYLQVQKAAMSGQAGAHTNWPELVAIHGYDTKYAMHALRLGCKA